VIALPALIPVDPKTNLRFIEVGCIDHLAIVKGWFGWDSLSFGHSWWSRAITSRAEGENSPASAIDWAGGSQRSYFSDHRSLSRRPRPPQADRSSLSLSHSFQAARGVPRGVRTAIRFLCRRYCQRGHAAGTRPSPQRARQRMFEDKCRGSRVYAKRRETAPWNLELEATHGVAAVEETFD
jgi:hypothetical protein